MIEKELDALRTDTEFLSLYLSGMSSLYRSRIFQVLRLIGRPTIIARGTDVNAMATQAAWSAGFNDAIDTLLSFKELVLDKKVSPTDLVMDFGGLDYALKRGDITKEEADAIRSGNTSNFTA